MTFNGLHGVNILEYNALDSFKLLQNKNILKIPNFLGTCPDIQPLETATGCA
jgi:hypothetical protein